MPLIHHSEYSTISLRVWQIQETESELWTFLGSWPVLEDELAAIKSVQRRLERLATCALLKQHFGVIMPVLYNPDGKPMLENGYNLSISHSGPYVAIMVSQTQEVAVDLEWLDPRAKPGESRISRVSHKFLNQTEIAFVKPYTPAEQAWMHSVIWSSKEVLFKLYSKGGVDFKEHLHILPFQPIVCSSIEARIQKSDFEATFRLHVENHHRWMMVYSAQMSRAD